MADTSAIPPLPTGFVLDTPDANADTSSTAQFTAPSPTALKVVVRGANVLPDPNAAPPPPLPAGYTLDTPSNAQADSATSDPTGLTDLQTAYAQALERVHKNEYPQMNPAQFSDYAKTALGPYSLMDQAQNAQTLGFGDELGSAIGAVGNQVRSMMGGGGPGFGQAYSDLSALEDARQKLGAAQNGPWGTAADILGSLSTFKAPEAAITALGTAAPAAQPLWKTMLQTGAVGGTLGAVQGAGTDNDNRMQGAETGGLTGAILGTALPTIVHGVASGIGYVADRMATGSAAQASKISPEAARVLHATMGNDGSLGSAGAARMAQAGHEAMLADTGPSAQQILDTGIQKSGAAGALASQRIAGRLGRDARSLSNTLDQTLGKPEGVISLRGDIKAASAVGRGKAYDAAYASPINYASQEGRHLEGLLGRVSDGDIAAANKMMREEGVASKQIVASVDANGNVTYKTMPDVRQIDYITRALNDRALETDGKGGFGGKTTAGAITGNLSKSIRASLRKSVPQYGIALDTAADPLRRSQAVLFGSKVLRQSTTMDMVQHEIEGATGPERSAMAQGIRSQIDEAMANVARAMTDPNMDAREAIKALRDLSTRANRTKVALVIGDAPAQRLFNEADRVSKSFDLRAALTNNSKTFARQNMDKTVNDITAGTGPMGQLMRGEPVNAGKHAIQIVTGMTPNAVAARQDSLYRELADILTQNGPQQAQRLTALQQMQQTLGRNANIYQGILSRGNAAAVPAITAGQRVNQ